MIFFCDSMVFDKQRKFSQLNYTINLILSVRFYRVTSFQIRIILVEVLSFQFHLIDRG